MNRFCWIPIVGVLLSLTQASRSDATSDLKVVLVGVDQYEQKEEKGSIRLENLKYASADVLELRDKLLTHGVPADSILCFADGSGETRPSYNGLVDQMKNLQTSKDDTVMFVFCGHGVNVGLDSYLLFPETSIEGNMDAGDISVEDALSVSELSSLLAELPGRNKIILTDACRNYSSRSADYDSAILTRYDLSDHLRKMALSGGGNDEVVIISSCLPGQVSIEHDDSGHGLFFSHFLEGLSGSRRYAGSRKP